MGKAKQEHALGQRVRDGFLEEGAFLPRSQPGRDGRGEDCGQQDVRCIT